MAAWIKTDGTITEVKADGENGKFTLRALMEHVGGYIDIVQCGRNVFMIVNDEGLRMRLKVNNAASLLASTHIVGDAVLLDGKELD